jgi:hypothetical protein
MTVPTNSILVEGSRRSTLVPGGLFLHCGVVITNEVTEQAAVILDVAVDRTQEPIGVNMVTIGFVILLVAGVIHQECT